MGPNFARLMAHNYNDLSKNCFRVKLMIFLRFMTNYYYHRPRKNVKLALRNVFEVLTILKQNVTSSYL